VKAYQCDMDSAPDLLDMLLARYGKPGAVQMEAFRAGPRSTRLRGASGGAIQAELTALEAVLRRHGVPLVTRPAAAVMTWASDKRLKAAGLDRVLGGGQRHALAAARHALYCAVHDLGLPDPLIPDAARGNDHDAVS
jgi:hypothetical protein